jgi:hypothetical protein
LKIIYIHKNLLIPGKSTLILPLLIFLFTVSPAFGSSLKKPTADAFSKYTSFAEKELNQRAKGGLSFLYEGDSPLDMARLLRGDTIVRNLNKNDNTPSGIIHDWIGTLFIPGAVLNDVTDILIDYDSHKNVFSEVIESEMVKKSKNHMITYLRFKKKEIITVVTDTYHEADLYFYPGNKAQLISRSTKIQEVNDFGTKDERLLPEGDDHGFLWRMNSYWSLEETGEGVVVECRSITLSRDIPTGLGFILKPITSRMPRNSLESVLMTLKQVCTVSPRE